MVTCSRPLVFAWPNKYSSCLSLHMQARAFILSDSNIFYTPGGGRTTAGSNAPGTFLVFFLVTCPRPSISLGDSVIGAFGSVFG